MGRLKVRHAGCQYRSDLFHHRSVRSKIREGHEDYMVTAQSWPNFLYAGYVCDINDVEKGLFKGPILVKVCLFNTVLNRVS